MPKITIYKNKDQKTYNYKEGSLLIDVLREQGFLLDAPCGGNGQCGKCKVHINNKESVLACQTRISDDCVVDLTNNDLLSNTNNYINNTNNITNGRYAVAVDLGTTTIEISLINLDAKQKIDTITNYNNQRTYGSDVITRIDYCINNIDGLETLSKLVRNQIINMISELCIRNQINIQDIKEGYLAGNTVMEHILTNINPSSIALAPFKPLSYFDDEIIDINNIPFTLTPCISGYVGGDIVAGLSTLDLTDKTILFIDIGTNGEMAIGNKDSLYTCSVACGPAFEGAEISCGISAIDGAINNVYINDNKLIYKTIGNKDVKGICGSGLIDLLSCLLDLNYVDESGYLNEDIKDNIYINQADIRKLQLAKAAISAGIKTLLHEVDLTYEDIDTLYIAGSFGNNLNINSASRIGMIPRELSSKVKLVGNTCLNALEQISCHNKDINELSKIKNISNYIELSMSKDFKEYFIEEMNFPEV